jgi:hypothetical protein
MRKTDFEKCCRNVENGHEVYLENVVNHEKGRIVYCTTDRFHVDMNGRRDSWLPQVCETPR